MSAVHPTAMRPAPARHSWCCGWKVSLAGDEQLPLCERCPSPAESRFYHFL